MTNDSESDEPIKNEVRDAGPRRRLKNPEEEPQDEDGLCVLRPVCEEREYAPDDLTPR